MEKQVLDHQLKAGVLKRALPWAEVGVRGQRMADSYISLLHRILPHHGQIYQLNRQWGLSVINAVDGLIISVICVGDMMGLSCQCSGHTRKPLIIYQIDKLVLCVSMLYDKQ